MQMRMMWILTILYLPVWPFIWAFETLFGSSKRDVQSLSLLGQ